MPTPMDEVTAAEASMQAALAELSAVAKRHDQVTEQVLDVTRGVRDAARTTSSSQLAAVPAPPTARATAQTTRELADRRAPIELIDPAVAQLRAVCPDAPVEVLRDVVKRVIAETWARARATDRLTEHQRATRVAWHVARETAGGTPTAAQVATALCAACPGLAVTAQAAAQLCATLDPPLPLAPNPFPEGRR